MIKIFRLVLRNIQRRPFHTGLTVFTVAVAVAALFASLWLGRGLERGLDLGIQRLGADIMVLPQQVDAKPEQMLFTGLPLNIYMDKSAYKSVLAIPGVKQATPQFFMKTGAAMCCSLISAGRVVGLDSKTDFVVGPWMHSKTKRSLKDHEAVIGSGVNAITGDFIMIRAEVFRVVEKLEPTGTGVDDSTFITMETARRLAKESPDLKQYWVKEPPEKLFSVILVRADDPDKTPQIAQAINKIPGVNAFTSLRVVQETRQRMRTVTSLLYALAGVLWLVSLVSLLGRFASLVMERKTEIGILRALGAVQWSVFRLILWEAGCLALAGSLVGIGLGWLVSRYVLGLISSGNTLPFLSLPPSEVASLLLLCLAAAIVTVLLSALFPAFRSVSLDPARAIAQGELE